MKKLIEALRSCDLYERYDDVFKVSPQKVTGEVRFTKYALMYNRQKNELFFLPHVYRDRAGGSTMQHALSRSVETGCAHIATLSAADIESGIQAVDLAMYYPMYI